MPQKPTNRHTNMFNIDINIYTEADVSSEFYHQCRLRDIELKMEVQIPSKVHRSGQMRADAVVVFDETPICCVEFKGPRCQKVKKEGLSVDSRQYRAYVGTGVPFFVCCGLDEIGETIENVEELLFLAGKNFDYARQA